MSYSNLQYKDTNPAYVAYRCINPTVQYVEGPWFRTTETCPCDVRLDNPTGRGSTLCPFGINYNTPKDSKVPVVSVKTTDNGLTYDTVPADSSILKPDSGFAFPKNVFTAPQGEPRPLVRVGYEWRDAGM
jgi:hypothetical protein